ncbi:pentatricopeptide repeat-containing protein At1g80270, mitochondrial-like [Silene latifolia]|uniref:pentatricopeptide repeat-containing protein At1g80270, mitochondrial-like n=1 Tax=Silene latifolia TaxID=37657 RepID=UPI003D7882B8
MCHISSFYLLGFIIIIIPPLLSDYRRFPCIPKMWAVRRASAFSLRAPGLKIAAFRACAGHGPVSILKEDKSSPSELHLFKTDRSVTSRSCNCTVTVPRLFSVGCRCLSSQAGANSSGEENDDLEDGFSELEAPETSETTEAKVVDGDSSADSASDSESDLSSLDDVSLEETLETDLLGETEEDAGKAASKKKYTPSPLLKLILEESGPSISGALDKYFEDKEFSRPELYKVFLNLRRRKLFGKALQLSEWFEKREDSDFSERDYASRVDLIAKVRGLQKAESYVDSIPKSFREEVVYRTLLANFVSATLVDKAEKLFNKMKDLDFPVTVFTCNQMLLLYKRSDRRKIADVLLMMEKENLKPSVFTYQVLIDTKGQSGDIHGMEQVVETMKAEGVEPDIRFQAVLARHYASAGHKEKAEDVLKEMEGTDLKNNPFICPIVLPIYAKLGNAEQVERIWKFSESSPRQANFFAAIDAYGKLKNIKQAEAIFEKMIKTYKKLTSRHYTIMLQVYAENKMLSKAKELLQRMTDAGCPIGPTAWDSLVKLYVDIGEIEKADSVLQKAVQHNPKLRPMFSTYMTILDQYSKRGDVHNAEKIFQRLRQAGYIARAKPFHALLQTYINAKVPAYGIRERMKADNLFPNKGLAAQLALVDAFRKTTVSELLE